MSEMYMARGIVIIGWDNEVGAIVEAKHPPHVKIDSNKATVVYSTHTVSSRNPCSVALNTGGLRAASYYAGPEIDKCLVVVLDTNENPMLFKEHLPEIVAEYFNNNSQIDYDKILPEIYERIARISEAGRTVKDIMRWF
ncbi:MAG: hypothetical protein ACFFBS_05770 [Promethearchaeota archaeon]